MQVVIYSLPKSTNEQLTDYQVCGHQEMHLQEPHAYHTLNKGQSELSCASSFDSSKSMACRILKSVNFVNMTKKYPKSTQNNILLPY